MIVVSTIAVASLMGLAMLSSSSLQAQMGDTIEHVAQADYLAESGIHYGMHQLRKTAASDDIYAGGTHDFGGEGRKRFVLTVARQPGSATHYRIESRGEVLDARGEVIASKTAQATAKVDIELKYNHAAVMGSEEFRLDSPGVIEIESAAARRMYLGGTSTITRLLAEHVSGVLGNVTEWTQSSAFAYRVTPQSAVRTFDDAKYLYSDGNLYDAVALSSGTIGSETLGPTANNPAGVYYRHGDVSLTGEVTIQGSLIVLNGNLKLTGPNNRIDASQAHSRGFPALVVRDGDITPAAVAAGTRLEVHGATWVGGDIAGSIVGAGSEMVFNGVVILPQGKILTKKMFAKADSVKIQYDPATANVPHLDRELISSVEVLTWTNR